jgi:hypothetical protein
MTKKHRKTIGENPLDAVIPSAKPLKAPGRAKGTKVRGRPAPAPEKSSEGDKVRRDGGKVRATFHIPGELLEECRDAVVHFSGPPLRLTLADLAENAIRKELVRLKKAHNEGKEFPARSGELRGGRPIKS